MEQRNGRLDRHGQRADAVRVYHFVGGQLREGDAALQPGDLDGDLEFLMRAAMKVNTIREDLGKVGPVLAQQVEDAMLGRRRSIDTTRAEEEARPLRRQLKFERDLHARLNRLAQQLRSAEVDLDINPVQTKRIVDIALELAGQPPLLPAQLPARDGRPAAAAWQLPPLTGSWTACADGMLHPHTREPRPLVFDHAVAAGRDDVVLAHLNHRLVAMALRLLRAEIWASGSGRGLHRVALRLVDDAAATSVLLLAHGRLVVVGGDGQRLHEEVLTAGGAIEQGRFVRLAAKDVSAAQSRVLQGDVPAHVGNTLRELWPVVERPLTAALDTRMRDRAKALQRKLAEREQRDIENIAAVLTELERGIRAELAVEEPGQLELWTLDEREQLRRNRGALERRLRELPAEREREIAAIRARYADPQPRMFPVAVEVLVPKRLR
jgi:hypothetical protein